MIVEFTAVLLGAAAGLAVLLLLIAVLPPAPVNLVAAIARVDARAADSAPGTDHGVGAVHWWRRLVALLAERSSTSANRWWGIPLAELDLLERAPTAYVAQRLAWGGGGLVGFGLLALAAGLGPGVVPLAVVGAVVGSVMPAAFVRHHAERARAEWRRAVTAYLDLVAQERASGAAPTQAVIAAASVAHGWVFRRIQVTLARARRAGIPPWEALAGLGTRLRVTALVDLADIVSSAADGAAVYTTLTAKAAALRNAALNDDRELANRRSEKLVGPLACLLIGFVILIVYPMFARL